MNLQKNKADELEVVETEKIYITIHKKRCTKGEIVGYCWSNLHKGYLTKQLMDEHECLKKQCPGFQKFQDAPYWVKKEETKRKKFIEKVKKKESEERKKRYLKNIRNLTIRDKNFYAVSIEEKNDVFIVRFIRFERFEYWMYIGRFRSVCDNAKMYLEEIKTDNLKKHQIIERVNIPKKFDIV